MTIHRSLSPQCGIYTLSPRDTVGGHGPIDQVVSGTRTRSRRDFRPLPLLSDTEGTVSPPWSFARVRMTIPEYHSMPWIGRY